MTLAGKKFISHLVELQQAAERLRRGPVTVRVVAPAHLSSIAFEVFAACVVVSHAQGRAGAVWGEPR
jgi:hypothetical protein